MSHRIDNQSKLNFVSGDLKVTGGISYYTDAATIQFPTNPGFASQVLSTDGIGTLNWVDKSGTVTDARSNTIAGTAVQQAATGNTNTVFGYNLLTVAIANTEKNTVIGANSATSLTSANNIVIGQAAVPNLNQGADNIAIGNETGLFGLAAGSRNLVIGRQIMSYGDGNDNVLLGVYSSLGPIGGGLTATISKTVAIGSAANSDFVSCDSSVIVGYAATGGRNNSQMVILGTTAVSNDSCSGSVAIGCLAQVVNPNEFVIGPTVRSIRAQDSTCTIGVAAAPFADILTRSASIWNPIAMTGIHVVNTAGAAANYTLTLPPTAGAAGQALTTDGTGVLKWSRPTFDGSNGIAIAPVPLNSNATGTDGIAIGSRAYATAQYDISIGSGAGSSGNTDVGQIAIGYQALTVNAGSLNLAIGYQALAANTSAIYNLAIGYQALAAATTGVFNLGIGYSALAATTTGGFNIAIGVNSMVRNVSGSHNIAIGYDTMANVSTNSSNNTAVGYITMVGQGGVCTNNTAMGASALGYVTTGSDNTLIGCNSGFSAGGNGLTTGNNNVLIGSGSNVSASANSNAVVVGFNATAMDSATAVGSTSSAPFFNSTALGYGAVSTANNTITLGNSAIVAVYSNNGIFTTSDARTKTNILENIPGISFITRLRPVTYHNDPDGIALLNNIPNDQRDFATEAVHAKTIKTGFIAQEVLAAAQSINYDCNAVNIPATASGIYSLSYAQFVVPLVQCCKEQQLLIADLAARLAAVESRR